MFKTTKFWLIVSLCVNLLLLGLFIGGAYHARKMGRSVSAPPNEISAIMRAMPEERRTEWVGEFRGRGHDADRPDIDQLASLIEADPFDADAVRDYFDENRRANDARIESAQSAMLQSLSQMSGAERDEMAQRIREMPKRHHNKPPRRRGDDH